MIEFFHTDEESRSLTKLDTEQPGCWIALFEPTAEELEETERWERELVALMKEEEAQQDRT